MCATLEGCFLTCRLAPASVTTQDGDGRGPPGKLHQVGLGLFTRWTFHSCFSTVTYRSVCLFPQQKGKTEAPLWSSGSPWLVDLDSVSSPRVVGLALDTLSFGLVGVSVSYSCLWLQAGQPTGRSNSSAGLQRACCSGTFCCTSGSSSSAAGLPPHRRCAAGLVRYGAEKRAEVRPAG